MTNPSGKTEMPHTEIQSRDDFIIDCMEKAEKYDELQIDSIPFDAEIEAVRQQYCAHSGRPLSKVPSEVVHNLITIHGRETCIKILKTQQVKYSYDWIWLNENGLNNLAIHKPAEYFVYAFSKLMQNQTIDAELSRLGCAAKAWRQLQSIDETVIMPINELLRRALANYKLKQIDKYLVDFTFHCVDEVTASIANLAKFQLELTDLIQTLVAKQKQLDEIERGMSAFRLQKMITTLSKLELEIGRELNDFDIVSGKSSDVIHGITGTQYRHSHIKQDFRKYSDKIRYSQQTIKTKAKPGFRLKLKGDSNG